MSSRGTAVSASMYILWLFSYLVLRQCMPKIVKFYPIRESYFLNSAGPFPRHSPECYLRMSCVCVCVCYDDKHWVTTSYLLRLSLERDRLQRDNNTVTITRQKSRSQQDKKSTEVSQPMSMSTVQLYSAVMQKLHCSEQPATPQDSAGPAAVYWL